MLNPDELRRAKMRGFWAYLVGDLEFGMSAFPLPSSVFLLVSPGSIMHV